MQIARTLIAAIFLLSAIFVVVMNWGCVIVSFRNQRKGIDRHHSTVPLVTILLAGFGCLAWPYQANLWILVIPLLDIANLILLLWPVWLLLHAWRNRSSDRKK